MASKRIGFEIEPGTPYTPAFDEGIHLNMASLGEQAKPGKSMLSVRVKDQEFVLCSLQYNEREQQALDIHFSELDEPTFILKGTNAIILTGDMEDEDEDFTLEDDLTMDEDDGRFRFCDTSDRRFLGGMELRHFGLVPHAGYEEDQIDLRKDEDTSEEKMLNDSICEGLINAMMNTGDEVQIQRARSLQLKLDAIKSNSANGNGSIVKNSKDEGKIPKQGGGKVTKKRSKRKAHA